MLYGAMATTELTWIGTRLGQGLATFSVKGRAVNSSGFAVVQLQLLKSVLQQESRRRLFVNGGCGCVPIKLYSQKQVAAGSGPSAIVWQPLL